MKLVFRLSSEVGKNICCVAPLPYYLTNSQDVITVYPHQSDFIAEACHVQRY